MFNLQCYVFVLLSILILFSFKLTRQFTTYFINIYSVTQRVLPLRKIVLLVAQNTIFLRVKISVYDTACFIYTLQRRFRFLTRINRIVHACMNARKYEIYFRFEQDISRVISVHPCILASKYRRL